MTTKDNPKEVMALLQRVRKNIGEDYRALSQVEDCTAVEPLLNGMNSMIEALNSFGSMLPDLYARSPK